MSAGYTYTFISQVPEEYYCSICHYPMRKPVQTKCGHRFCKYCLEESMKRNPQCPIDQTGLAGERKRLSGTHYGGAFAELALHAPPPPPRRIGMWDSTISSITYTTKRRQEPRPELQQDIFPDIASERTILSYQVKCPNQENGCQWTSELRKIENHEGKCDFAKSSCTNENCNVELLKKDLHDHVTNKCPRRRIKCTHCSKVSYVWCLRQDHFDVCSKFPCLCPQKCGQNKIPREETNKHVKNDCPETLVECTFGYVDCKEKVKRKDLGQHLRDNSESHLNLTCKKLQEVQTEHNTTKTDLQKVRAEHEDTKKKLTQLQTEYETTKTEYQGVRAEHDETKKKLQQLENTTEIELQELRVNLRRQNERLQYLASRETRWRAINPFK